ncbi:MAG: type II toxin-antitoxin system RelE/ParE family toxin [Rhodospirillaceae bacterium]|nr:type II toxin-antitoxin system RelE/ParE family toxin [Rhodospirillaceae bacterium]
MIVVETTRFSTWFAGLRDKVARVQIGRRIERLKAGNPGDVSPVGEGVSEMRIHHGPGYRVYFVQRGDITIILLCGGDKKSRARDIALAKDMARQL